MGIRAHLLSERISVMTDHWDEFQKRGTSKGEPLSLFLFAWRDAKGQSGEYGLNVGPAHKTFQTLIQTTYMFQDKPSFQLYCRPFEMTAEQFEYLQEHDLDTEEFLKGMGPLPEICTEIDLSLYASASEALESIITICD
jgi:hypothetical protein